MYLIHIISFKHFKNQINNFNLKANKKLYLYPKGECNSGEMNSFLGFSRNTIHFTINSIVENHSAYKKEKDSVAIVAKMKDMLYKTSYEVFENNLYGGGVEDIFFTGPIAIPKSSKIFISERTKDPDLINYLKINFAIEPQIYKKLDLDIKNYFDYNLKVPYFKLKTSNENIFSIENISKNKFIDSEEVINILNKEYNSEFEFCTHDSSGLLYIEQAIMFLIWTNVLAMDNYHDFLKKALNDLNIFINKPNINNFIKTIFTLDIELENKKSITEKFTLLEKCIDITYLLELESFCIADRIKITKEEIPEESRELFLKRVSEYVTNIKSL